MNTRHRPRVAFYGVGQYGSAIAKLAYENNYEIVAAYNRAGQKVGKDLGEFIGLGRDIGIVVEDCDKADYTTLNADIAIVALTDILEKNFVAYERLLNAGVNVGCHGGQSYYPFGCNAELAKKIDEMAKNNGVTFTGSGIWDMSRIWAGILAVGPCTKTTSLYHRSITDAAGQMLQGPAGAEQAKSVIGIGMSKEEFTSQGMGQHPMALAFVTNSMQVLEYHDFTISNSKTFVEPMVFDYDYKSPWNGEILKAGTCMGSRIVSIVETEQGATARTEVEGRLFHEGELEHTYWEVDGQPRSSIRVDRKDSRQATAGCLFNRIPDIIQAPPGIVPVSKFKPLKASSAFS